MPDGNPRDAPHQDLLDFTASVPGTWRVVREPEQGDSFQYAEIDGVEARVLPEDGKPTQLSRTELYNGIKPSEAALVAGH